MISLSNQDISILKDLSVHITASPSNRPGLFCKQAKMCSNYLPEHIQKKMQDFAKNGSEKGFLLIRAAPLGEIHDTPSTNNQKRGESTLLAKIQAIFVQSISEMLAYEAEGYGRLFQDIVPMKSMSEKQVSVGNSELEIHTEQAFSELRPDILSLACLRGDRNAKTFIFPVKKILDNLSKEDSEFLRKDLWKTGVDLSFKLMNNLIRTPGFEEDSNSSRSMTDKDMNSTGEGQFTPLRIYPKGAHDNVSTPLINRAKLEDLNVQSCKNFSGVINSVDSTEDMRGPFPIISGSQEDPFLRFDQDLMKGITEESNQMVKKIVDLYYEHREQHCLEPGDIVLIDNNRAVHGRSGFSPRYDGKDRFLIRCFSTFDFTKSEYARTDGERMISAIYS